MEVFSMDWRDLGEILEMVMIVCFGISWPLTVYKSYKARTAKGKSVVFLFAIWFGYVAGICGKILQDNITITFYFYIVNIIVVSADIALYFRNKALDRRKVAEKASYAETPNTTATVSAFSKI